MCMHVCMFESVHVCVCAYAFGHQHALHVVQQVAWLLLHTTTMRIKIVGSA